MSQSRRFLYLFLLALMLTSCATTRHTVLESPGKIYDLHHQPYFELQGKMSFSDGSEGGSGQVRWEKSEQQIQVVLKAPLSSKSWTLVSNTLGATMEDSAGGVYHSLSAADLLSDQVGWPVPWEALQHWIIGVPTESGQLEWDADQQGYTVVDQGWVIKYSRLNMYDTAVLPHKIIARKHPYSIKLSVKSWQW